MTLLECRLAEAAALAAAQAEAAQQDAHATKLAAAQQADKASLLQQNVQLAQQRQAQVHAAIRIRADARQWHLKTQEAAAKAHQVCCSSLSFCAVCMHVAFVYNIFVSQPGPKDCIDKEQICSVKAQSLKAFADRAAKAATHCSRKK